MYKRILVPVDNSATSRAALEEAKRFAKSEEAEVRLVHVIDLAQFAWSANEFLDVPRLQASLREGGQAVLKESTAAMQAAGITPDSAMLETWGGLMSEVIIEDAGKWNADLIIMGTHGYGGLKHVLLGSVAEGVVRHAPVPVLLVRLKE
ncbi:Nucleotide-binding universal stress protein, UspA family [Formivibrio citricus]|uniref:Universal stress protein n=1 Tax=Formivibrio citricus TaxID=83765 RepID=A0A1I4X721_9NEIS|nr:universal stress protein [Formivibrio citricus]SFN21684.1 Nucleotide-binding universal stress protein, UspA family [Formivibrio citricus]